MISLSKKNIKYKLIYFSLLFLLISNLVILYYSYRTILHQFSYSQIFISYVNGFVKDGFLGEIVFLIQYLTNLDFKIIITTIFGLFHILNSILFFLITKRIAKIHFVLFILIFFNPALIFFTINDIGAFLRKEIFVIFGLMSHVYLSILYRESSIDLIKYKKYFIFLILPTLLISLAIYEMQLFLLPLHFLIIKKNLKLSYFDKKTFFYTFISIFFILVFFYYSRYNIDVTFTQLLIDNTKIRIGNFLINDLNFNPAPYVWLAKNHTDRFKDILYIFSNANFLLKYVISIILSLGPIFIIICNFFKITKIQKIEMLVFFSPLFLLFVLGEDWGRWIHIICMSLIMYSFIYDLNYKKHFSPFIFLIFVLFTFIYVFFFNLSHCCVKNLFGYGLGQNLELAYKIFFKNFNIIENIKY
jgi:hypothetical protein